MNVIVKKDFQDEATSALIKTIKKGLIDERSANAILKKISKLRTRNQTLIKITEGLSNALILNKNTSLKKINSFIKRKMNVNRVFFNNPFILSDRN
jgi:hypothetical protein